MIAAAQYARGDTDTPPPLLRWWWMMCEHGLPYAGGWMDQPAGLLERMSMVARVYEAVRERDGMEPGKLAQWKRDNPDKAHLLRWLDEVKHGDG